MWKLGLLVLFFLSCSACLEGANINITSNVGSSEWWLALAVSDPSTTGVELMDSGSYPNWTPFQATNWGYWVFATNGFAITFPISLRLSSGPAQVVLQNIMSNPSPGKTIATGVSFSQPGQPPSTTPPSNPTNAPPQPANPPPQTPTTPATNRPPKTPSPPANSPSTSAPTVAPPPFNPPPQGNPSPTGNPFEGTQYYLNPHYSTEIDSSIAQNPSLESELSVVKNFATAYWIDSMSVIPNLTTILTQARSQATQSGSQVMAAIVIYDLPNRDCAAGASGGEITCADATCAAGLNTYETEYINPIFDILQSFPDITVVAVVEPDSLPNLATNLGIPNCQEAQTAYITGVAYAIQKLSQLSNVYLYVDAAHGGWLGWQSNLNAAVTIFKQVLTQAGSSSKIRGFSTNVANYQPLGSMNSTDDPCNLQSQYNFAINEVKYVNLLDTTLIAGGITGMHYIIDTGRNGVPNSRTDCSNWCNIKNSGLGVPPTSDTASSGVTNIDAYFWVKPPGESDGVSDPSSPRFDASCISVDSMVPSPEAGQWFSALFVSEAGVANPPLQ